MYQPNSCFSQQDRRNPPKKHTQQEIESEKKAKQIYPKQKIATRLFTMQTGLIISNSSPFQSKE